MAVKGRMQSVSVAIGAADVQALGPNPVRQSLTFSAPRVARYSVGFGQPAVLDTGITIQIGANPVTITREDVGDDIASMVRIISTGAGESIGIVELSA